VLRSALNLILYASDHGADEQLIEHRRPAWKVNDLEKLIEILVASKLCATLLSFAIERSYKLIKVSAKRPLPHKTLAIEHFGFLGL